MIPTNTLEVICDIQKDNKGNTLSGFAVQDRANMTCSVTQCYNLDCPYNHNDPPTPVEVKAMTPREKKESNTLRKKVARQAWGPINSQYTVTKGVTWFDTWGHGGYVVDALMFPEVKSIPNFEKFERTPLIRDNSRTTYYYPRHVDRFYIFEEDCDWAVLSYFTNIWSKEYEYHKRKHTGVLLANAESSEAWREYAKDVVETWNPELLQ